MIFFKKLNKIQAITFDLDDTLYQNTSVILKAEKSLLDFMHNSYPVTRNLDKAFWRKQQKAQLVADPELKNDMSQLRRLSLHAGFNQLGISGSQLSEATEACFRHFYYARSDFTLSENIHSLLKSLSTKVPLVAITNGNVNVQQIGLDDYFTSCFKANKSMPMKPHRSMFDAAQSKLQIPQKYILHVGDNLEKDIFGALQAGFQTAWYAEDRAMILNNESAQLIPHVQLDRLEQLIDLV